MSSDLAASIRARLLNRAKANGEEFERTLARFAAERLLFRLGASSARDRCILKGASLLSVWLRDPYRADVLVLAADGQPRHESYDYWDFGRKQDGRDEFYFVEMNTENGMFQTWRAVETTENELSFLRRTAS